jgi:hypothetical protein
VSESAEEQASASNYQTKQGTHEVILISLALSAANELYNSEYAPAETHYIDEFYKYTTYAREKVHS